MQNIKQVIHQLINYTVIDESIQNILIQQLNEDKTDHELNKIKSLINQIDYQQLHKANKMDIEIIQSNHNKIQLQIQDCIQKLQQIQQIDTIELIQQNITEQLDLFKQSIQFQSFNQIDEQIKNNLMKYEKLLPNFEKIQYILETKADQSQFAEIMQSKVSILQFQQLKSKFNETLHHLKYLMEAILTFFEASISEQDSINMRKSDQIKSINLVKNILTKIQPSNDDLKSQPMKFSVKLKPTIFKSLNNHQRRIKTEINEL